MVEAFDGKNEAHLLKYLTSTVPLSVDHRHRLTNHLESIFAAQVVDQSGLDVDAHGGHQRVNDVLWYDSSDLID